MNAPIEPPSNTPWPVTLSVWLIREAQRLQPSMRYALATLALAAIAGLGSLIAYGVRLEIVVPACIIVMIALVIFRRVATAKSSDVRLPALVMIWAVTILFVAVLSSSFTAVAFGSPHHLRAFLLGEAPMGEAKELPVKPDDPANCKGSSIRISTGDNSPVINCASGNTSEVSGTQE